jgi:hypothetical protein
MMTMEEQSAARSKASHPMMAAIIDLNLTYEAIRALGSNMAGPIYMGGLRALPAPVVIGTAYDALAIDLGYTRRVEIEGGCQGGEFLIQPDADLDDRFKAWGVDWQEWTWVNGWNVLIAECGA